MTAASAEEWKQLSTKWRESLNKLINTIDTVNRNRNELERQKQQLRSALTQGPNRYAYAYGAPESAYLSPLAGDDGPEYYFYDYTQYRPIPSYTTAFKRPTVIDYPVVDAPTTFVVAPAPSPAGWISRGYGYGPTLSFEDALSLNSVGDATIVTAEAIADDANRITPIRPAFQFRSISTPSLAQFPNPLPMVSQWRADQQRRAIATQAQRVFNPEDIVAAFPSTTTSLRHQ